MRGMIDRNFGLHPSLIRGDPCAAFRCFWAGRHARGGGSGVLSFWVRESPPPVEWSADLQTVADGGNHFALDLYGKLAEKEKGNVFFSPYSVHTASRHDRRWRRGKTREQMVKVLHLPAEEEKMLAAGDVGRYYAHPRRAFQLSVANSIWGRKDYGWRPEFLGIQKTRFGTELQHADFAADPEHERERINRWVEKKTRNRIKELLVPGQSHSTDHDGPGQCHLLQGEVGPEFDKEGHAMFPFHLANDSIVKVPMMHTDTECGYAQRDGLSLVELPYKGGELSMVVILPQFPDGLPALEKQLDAADSRELARRTNRAARFAAAVQD